MYPNGSHWASYGQYNMVPGGLATSRSAVPTLDQTSLTAAAGLSHNLQTHTSLPQRVLSTIPGVSLSRDLHSQLLGAMTSHVGGLGTQALHKAGLSLTQNSLAYDSMGVEQGIPVTTAGFSPDKALSMEGKDTPQTYSSPTVSQSQDLGQKTYVLYDYFPQLTSNAFNAFSSVDLTGGDTLTADNQRLSQPPPAHSSVSRHSAIQRNPYSTEAIMVDTPSAKPPVSASMTKPSQSQLGVVYSMLDDSQQSASVRSSAHTPQPQVESYVLQDLKDRGTSQHNSYYCPVTTYTTTPPTTSLNMAGSQLEVGSVSYEAVSPAGALPEAQTGDATFPSTVSLSDLNAIRAGCSGPRAGFKATGSSIQGLSRSPSVSQPEGIQIHSSHLLDQLSQGRGLSKAQLAQITGGRHQHSPLRVDNPQSVMSSLGSSQNMLPSSTIKPGVAPVQAVADSSTAVKPKKPRKPRKPKNTTQNDTQTQSMQADFASSMSPAFMSSSQGYARGSNNFQSQSQQQQYQQQDNQSQMQQQQQYLTSSQAVMGGGSLSSEGSYTDQSSRSQQQQSTEGSTLISMPNARLSTSPNKGSSVSEAGSYQSEQSLLSQGAQYDMQVYTSQPYMEQLVSGQSARLIPSNLYSESMHVAAGIVYPYTFQTADGSTIDTATFSSLLMDTESGRADQQQQGNTVVDNSTVEREAPVQASVTMAPAAPPAPPSPPPKPAATCTNPLEEDDELCNFARPPPELAEKEKPMPHPPALMATRQENTQQQDTTQSVPKLELKLPLGARKTATAFQDTFLSFLMGQKQETLSSVTATVITERPQLPKYIPEPRRPRPPPPPSPPPSAPTQTSTQNSVAFSDEEEDGKVNVAVKKAISALDSDSNDSEMQEVSGKYCVQSTNDLTMKITLQNTLKKQNKPRGRPAKIKTTPVGRGLVEGTKVKTTREPTPPPPRESIGRRAKDAAKEKNKKRKKYQDSDTSDFEGFDGDVKASHHPGGSGSEYDSDKDPVWTPLEEQEAKRNVGFGFDMSEPKSKKGKSKSKKSHKKHHRHSEGELADPVVFEQMSGNLTCVEGNSTPHKTLNSGNGAGGGRTAHTKPAEDQANNIIDENFQVGKFLLEKSDVGNCESFPIWRVEPGHMLRKFELTMHNGRICHRAVSTYSTIVPSMQTLYLPIQASLVSKSNPDLVEVKEQHRPKPSSDISLEMQFENDPLVESFSIYLQTYLSQSLEPTFLTAILSQQAEHVFYLAPMEEIDKIINDKLEEIDRLVKWKPLFRDAMRSKPQMKEIVRPSLKQSCQACEKSSPPTIKSVLFHGSAYDKFLLNELPDSNNSSQEFLVGKFAAPYVTQYHSLHHFKHHLLQRCRAKVYMVRESQQNENLIMESILDQCLQDRMWVLKIFQDFKRLLGEAK